MFKEWHHTVIRYKYSRVALICALPQPTAPQQNMAYIFIISLFTVFVNFALSAGSVCTAHRTRSCTSRYHLKGKDCIPSVVSWKIRWIPCCDRRTPLTSRKTLLCVASIKVHVARGTLSGSYTQYCIAYHYTVSAQIRARHCFLACTLKFDSTLETIPFNIAFIVAGKAPSGGQDV